MLTLNPTLSPFLRFADQFRKTKTKGISHSRISERFLSEINRGAQAKREMRPHMSADEAQCYGALLARSRTVIEYGSGGSTLMALEHGCVRKLVSVESDPAWVAQLESVPVVADAVDRDIANLIYVNIGKVGSWGKPTGREMIDQWFRYPAAPWQDLPDPDLVLVDGRFRVACVMETVLRASPRTLIAVHDFWDRPKYHVVLPFLDWQQSCGTLGVFRVKPGGDRTSAVRLLEAGRLWSD